MGCKGKVQDAGAFRFLPFFSLSVVDAAPFDLGCPLIAFVFEALSGVVSLAEGLVAVVLGARLLMSSTSSMLLRISRSRVINLTSASSFFSFSLETSLYRTV